MGRKKHTPREDRIQHMDKDILDVAGAAALLGVSTSTIYKQAHAGKLPGQKIGREWRFHRRTLLAWVAETSSNGSLAPSGLNADELSSEQIKELIKAGKFSINPGKR